MPAAKKKKNAAATFVHPTATVDQGAVIGPRTAIWHYAHVMPGARIGADCMLGHSCFVATGVVVGDGCRIQNHVSIFEGVELERDVFVGPSAVFTNVKRPRAAYPRKPAFVTTRIGRGATIGANATVVCGITVGAHAFVGAGTVLLRDVPEHAVVVGAPARTIGFICACGEQLLRRRVRPANEICKRCGLGPGLPARRR